MSEYKLLSGYDKVLAALCQSKNCWGIYISHVFSAGIGPHELARAAPFLEEGQAMDFWHYESGYLLFDSEEQMLLHYNQVKGDDGPTRSNPYDGPASIFAVTCNPSGELMDVNT